LTENAVQAIARDLMVAAMYRVEEAGYRIVLSVHDELVSEAEPTRDVKEYEKLVAGPNPEWAKGCPVAAEAWTGPRYRK
jgi:DNA polymerase